MAAHLMAAIEPEAIRLKRCRELFERAAAENVTLPEARRRMAQERWAATDRKLASARCGTADVARDNADQDGRQLDWWQR